MLVASAAALFRRVVPRAPFESLCEMIASGSTLDRDATVAALVRAGFSRSPVVEDAGTFAVRGAVIDLFPPIYKHPIRIELFGDEVESIRLYDAATQRTLRPLDAVYLHPVRETIPTAGADPRARILAAADAAVYPVVEDAPPARADRGGRAVLRHRGAGARVPRRHGAAVRLPARGRRCAWSRSRRR